MPELVAVGELLVEMMAEKEGQSFSETGRYLGPYPSGAPAICISQAARLGASCKLIGCVGLDAFGQLMLTRLLADGVDVTGIQTLPGIATGVAFVTYSRGGERSFIFHFGNSAAGRLTTQDIDEKAFAGVKICHVMGCSLTASEELRLAVVKAVRICKAMGARISFDPNLRPELLAIEETRETVGWILQNTDILLTGSEEITALLRCGEQEAVNRQQKCGTKIIVLKSGDKGARIVTKDMDKMLPRFTVRQVDPTGAGDCFDGAFLAMLLEGKTPWEAGCVASAAGALAVTKQGPMQGATYMPQIQQLMGEGSL